VAIRRQRSGVTLKPAVGPVAYELKPRRLRSEKAGGASLYVHEPLARPRASV
jgi:hypothetical protein